MFTSGSAISFWGGGVPPLPDCTLAESPRGGEPPLPVCALAKSPRAVGGAVGLSADPVRGDPMAKEVEPPLIPILVSNL
jgi:hypothetical protein